METTATETKKLVAKIDIDPTMMEKKRIAWGDLGVSIYENELLIQARAQQSIAKIKIPTKIEEVKDAEVLMKEIKADCAAITNSRKSITSKFDDVSKRLMEPEKSFLPHIEALEKSIIALKKADEEKKRVESQKIEKRKQCREFLINTKNNAEAAFQNKINEKVAKVYEYALGEGNIGMAELADFIKLALTRLTEVDFKIQYPLNSFSDVVTTDEYMALCNELLIFDSKKYLSQYENEIRAKFTDYEVALNNKAEALKLAKDAAAAKAQDIQNEKANADVAAKLSTLAIAPVVSNDLKALKQSYELDMEESVENMIAIVTAFAANIHLCLPKLKVNKWFACTASQLGIALAKVKCDDNNFQPSGITFKQVDKL
jgi:hypothetical protein